MTELGLERVMAANRAAISHTVAQDLLDAAGLADRESGKAERVYRALLSIAS